MRPATMCHLLLPRQLWCGALCCCMQLAVLERAVVSAGRCIDARLMAVLHSTGELERHCQAIRRYLLMGQVGTGTAQLMRQMVHGQQTVCTGICVTRCKHGKMALRMNACAARIHAISLEGCTADAMAV